MNTMIPAAEAPATTRRREQQTEGSSYFEGWAARYWRSQQKIERDRLRNGMARHRAHRDPLPGKPAHA